MDRKKTTVMMPGELLERIDKEARRMGTSRNAFLSFGAVFLLGHISRSEGTRRRNILLRELSKTFQELLEDARKAA